MESKSYKIIKEHISSFPNPITLKKGDKVFVGSAITLCDYSANELNVKIGDEISIHKYENGWAWSANSIGKFGWVPLNNIKIQPCK
jgi:hypothetical protein